ncbi:MAG: tetratricopeptide repeat protein [Deltaproteobacteria bacterium]|nr:tetratricopeptide repeat protein [Deltaproteobacteria bacterium]
MDDQIRELVALGREHFHRGDFSLAAGHLEQVVARGHDFPDVHHMLGCIYHQLGEFESAEKAFTRALELNPGYVEAALNLAIVLNDLGKYEQAQEVYGAALLKVKASGKDKSGEAPLDGYSKGKLANLHAAVGDGYNSVHRPKDAAIEYRRALDLCPTFVDVRLKLGNSLRDAGELEAALVEYRTASRAAPAYLPARVALGTALYSAGRIDEAIQQWEAVLEVDPEHRTAAMYLKLAKSPAAPAAQRGR